MDKDWIVATESDFDPADMNAIVAGLTEFNASMANGDVPRYVLVTVRNGKGALLGGLLGVLYLGWMQVYALWLPDELRGKGIGTALMREAEQEALRRGCPRMFLETLSFQAPGFYRRLGFEAVAEVADKPLGHTEYVMRWRAPD